MILKPQRSHGWTLFGLGLAGLLGCASPTPVDLPPPNPDLRNEIRSSIESASLKWGGPTVTGASKGVLAGSKISNVWAESDIKQVLADLSMQSGIPILMDPNVAGTVTLTVKEATLESAMDQILIPLGFVYNRFGEGYLVGGLDTKSSLFPLLTVTQLFKPQHMRADELRPLMPDAYQPFVKVDAKRNTIIMTGPASVLVKMRGLLTDLDQQPNQILIEALVVDLTKSGLMDLGISWTARTMDGSNHAATGDNTGIGLTWGGPYSAISLLTKIKALETSSKARIVASPRILAMEGENASIFIGQEQYFSFQSGPLNFPFITVEKVPAGIELEMTVMLAGKDDILVDVRKAEASTAVPTADNRPLVNRRKAATKVRIPNGGTIAIGGLVEHNRTESYQGVPFLARIPFLGALTGTRHSTSDTDELVIFLSSYTTKSRMPTDALKKAQELLPAQPIQ